jgi:GYF domain 2
MRREDWSSEGWYYRQDGQTIGPLSAEQLGQLLALGRLQSRQAVWKEGSHCLLFVHAAAAANGTNCESHQMPYPQPVSG